MIKVEGVILHWEKKVSSTNVDELCSNPLGKKYIYINLKNYFSIPHFTHIKFPTWNVVYLSLIAMLTYASKFNSRTPRLSSPFPSCWETHHKQLDEINQDRYLWQGSWRHNGPESDVRSEIGVNGYPCSQNSLVWGVRTQTGWSDQIHRSRAGGWAAWDVRIWAGNKGYPC